MVLQIRLVVSDLDTDSRITSIDLIDGSGQRLIDLVSDELSAKVNDRNRRCVQPHEVIQARCGLRDIIYKFSLVVVHVDKVLGQRDCLQVAFFMVVVCVEVTGDLLSVNYCLVA